MGFSRPEYWSGLPFPSPGSFPIQGLNPGLLWFLHWQADSLPSEPPGKLKLTRAISQWCRFGQALSTPSEPPHHSIRTSSPPTESSSHSIRKMKVRDLTVLCAHPSYVISHTRLSPHVDIAAHPDPPHLDYQSVWFFPSPALNTVLLSTK